MEWISVKDRLPKKDSNDVLVTDGNAQAVAYFTHSDNEWDFFRQKGDNLWNSSEVTHWMPLPEPPKS